MVLGHLSGPNAPWPRFRWLYWLKVPPGYFKLLIGFQSPSPAPKSGFWHLSQIFRCGTELWISLLHRIYGCPSELLIVFVLSFNCVEGILLAEKRTKGPRSRLTGGPLPAASLSGKANIKYVTFICQSSIIIGIHKKVVLYLLYFGLRVSLFEYTWWEFSTIKTSMHPNNYFPREFYNCTMCLYNIKSIVNVEEPPNLYVSGLYFTLEYI